MRIKAEQQVMSANTGMAWNNDTCQDKKMDKTGAGGHLGGRRTHVVRRRRKSTRNDQRGRAPAAHCDSGWTALSRYGVVAVAKVVASVVIISVAAVDALVVVVIIAVVPAIVVTVAVSFVVVVVIVVVVVVAVVAVVVVVVVAVVIIVVAIVVEMVVAVAVAFVVIVVVVVLVELPLLFHKNEQQERKQAKTKNRKQREVSQLVGWTFAATLGGLAGRRIAVVREWRVSGGANPANRSVADESGRGSARLATEGRVAASPKGRVGDVAARATRDITSGGGGAVARVVGRLEGSQWWVTGRVVLRRRKQDVVGGCADGGSRRSWWSRWSRVGMGGGPVVSCGGSRRRESGWAVGRRSVAAGRGVAVVGRTMMEGRSVGCGVADPRGTVADVVREIAI